jgi:4-amino-4-deoxy-L-arabinose transferase-like glycosyltransferase
MRPSFFIVLSVAMLIALTQLGSARLWDRDEPRNAQCAREMLAANNWIVPTFDGELRTHKPVLLYWGQMASYRVFGVNEWSARLPSALAGVLTALLVYVTARRFASEDVATYSGIAISSMLLFAMATRAATPDGVLILSVTLAIALFARFAWRPDDAEYSHFGLRSGRAVWPTHLQWIAIYAACGLAV